MKSGDSKLLSERESRVLRHIARYRMTFQEVLSALFFGGKSPQKTLDALRSRGLIQSIQTHGMSRRRQAYTLQDAATPLIRVPRSRANPLKGTAVEEQFAKLSYCYLSSLSACYVEPNEAPFAWEEVFGKNRHLSLVVRECEGGHVLDLVSLVGERTRKASCKERLTSLSSKVGASEVLSEFARSGHLQVVLLGQTAARTDQVRAWLQEDDWKGITGQVPVAARHIPWFEQLEEVLRELVA